jgi:hypothetical protein
MELDRWTACEAEEHPMALMVMRPRSLEISKAVEGVSGR